MGIPVLILGESGSGKSTSLRNFEPEEISIFNVAGKPLPFRKQLPKMNRSTYGSIEKALSKPSKKAYAIDDSQYLMAFELFDKVNQVGYRKFTDMAVNFKGLIDFIIIRTPPDIIVYFLHHVQKTESGIKAKTVGKMLDDQLTVEGLFSIVLMAEYSEGGYHFRTHTTGTDTIKSPMGMFDSELIDNDLKFVDAKIREYWNLGGNANAKAE